ncbi:MAG: DUF3237 domain-containing protein [Parasphingopyxis sp.]
MIEEHLCTIDFHVDGGLLALGQSPFGEQRVGYISGGTFEGPKLSGIVLPGGGNWSRAGRLSSGEAVGTFDARAVLQTHDGAHIYMTYSGRSVVPDDVRAEFGNPEKADQVDPARYYLRIAPVFETASADYDWLNGILAIGKGERTELGARQHLYIVR